MRFSLHRSIFQKEPIVKAIPSSGRAIWLVLALIAIVVLGAGCAPTTPAPVAATSAPTVAAAPPDTPTSVPVANPPATAATNLADVPVGVDADGNFYRGDPNAPVKLVEFSDFQ